ncbi:MAG: efflux RND transporter periplasmic adaptor subunit [Acidobacteria bacterium]|nr:efflux RND transporter periplasmic adaptor subunit [Acidobacteriota bacterium]
MSKKKKIFIICGGMALMLLVILAILLTSRKGGVSVQTTKAERVDVLTSKVTASGEIRAEKYVNLQSEVAGIITEIMVNEGDSVQKGDVLLQIDPIQRDADKNIAVAGYEQAVADVRNRKIDLVNAELDLQRDLASLNQQRADLLQKEDNYKRQQSSFRRQQKLHEEGLLSHDEYEAAQNSLNSAKSILEIQRESIKQTEAQIELSKNRIEQMKLSVKNAEAAEKSAKARLVQAQDNAKKSTVISPQDGVIVKLAKEEGERAVPGNQNNPEATIMEIADLSIIQAELKVDETEIIGLALGDYAEVEVDALPDVKFKGEVTEIGNSPIAGTSQQEAKDFKVVVTLKDPSPKLRPGLSCTADITTDTRENVLAIPIQALTIREVEVDENGAYIEPDLDSGKKGPVVEANTDSEEDKEEIEGVFVIDEKMRARFRPIKTGITGESDIEVLENLKEGEEIITGSFQTLRTIKDGEYVKISNKDQSESE